MTDEAKQAPRELRGPALFKARRAEVEKRNAEVSKRGRAERAERERKQDVRRRRAEDAADAGLRPTR